MIQQLQNLLLEEEDEEHIEIEYDGVEVEARANRVRLTINQVIQENPHLIPNPANIKMK